jgi:hypothetical protein
MAEKQQEHMHAELSATAPPKSGTVDCTSKTSADPMATLNVLAQSMKESNEAVGTKEKGPRFSGIANRSAPDCQSTVT